MNALDDIAAERRRQIEAEGWAPEHDDIEHREGQLAAAGACYARHAALQADWASSGLEIPKHKAERVPGGWPWTPEWWKPSDQRRNLVKAAALLVAEIERIDRATDQPSTVSANGERE